MKQFNFALLARLDEEMKQFIALEKDVAHLDPNKDLSNFRKLSRKYQHAKIRSTRIQNYLKLVQEYKENQELYQETQKQSSSNQESQELLDMIEEELKNLEEIIDSSEEDILRLLLPVYKDEGANLIIEIRAGTGGDEAALFVADLFRMYSYFSERHKLRLELISQMPTGIGGYKEMIFSLKGEKAFELMHNEGGIHRVQRIPSTENNGRIHTSAVTIAVIPELEEDEVIINDKDLQIDVFRASGAGGQHVNKTESAIRLTHMPSGIVISCQDERSQLKNKARALRILRARLGQKQQLEREAGTQDIRKQQVQTGDRSERIRTYNFPQGRITDHRIHYTAYNLFNFMEGNMDELVHLLLANEKEQALLSFQNIK